MTGARARRFTATALAAALVLTAAACSGRSATVQPPAGAGSGSPSAPAADWGSCRGVQPVPGATLECAVITVPADWDRPDSGETMEIALLRARADEQDERIGSLVINPGGPGGSGVDFAAYLAQTLPMEILRRFDIVGFDPRGVARSSPVDCIADEVKEQINGYAPDPVSQDAFDGLVDLQRQAADACYSEYGDGLAAYASVEAARDMDAVRAAVGDPKLTYLGYSYGTLLGSIYAQQNGRNLRAAVLDGAVDPGLDDVTTSEGQAAAFEQAFDNFAEWCRSNAGSCDLGDDPRAYVMDLMADAEKKPATSGGREATAGWILTAVIAALYDESAWPYVAAALTQTADGDPGLLFQIADSYVGRSPDGSYDNSTDAFIAVTCSDDETTETVEDVRRLQGEWREKYPMFGAPLATTLLPCALWRAPANPYPTGAASGGPPIVVVGTTGDPATPYENTAKLASQLGTGVVLTWEGEGHTAYPKTSCVAEAVNAYLLELTPPPAGTVCPAT